MPAPKPDPQNPTISSPTVSLQRGNRQVLAPIAAEWRALCVEGPCDHPCLGPDWIDAYLAAFEPNARVALFTVRVEGRLRGVLPLVERRIGFGPFAFRWYRSAAGVHSPHFDLVHGAGDRQSVVNAIWRHFQQWKDWDVLWFRSVMGDGRLADIVRMAKEDGHPTVIRGKMDEWYVPIAPQDQDFASVIAGRSKKFRRQLKQDFERLSERGEVRLRVLSGATDPERFREGLETFYVIEAAGWKGAAGSAIISDPTTLSFYNTISEIGFRQGFILLHLLELDGKAIAASLGILAGSQVIGLKIAYDETLSSYSPGHLLAAHRLAHSAGQGLTQYILGATPVGDHSYKSAWTSTSRPGFTGIIHQTNLRGRASHLALIRLLPRMQNWKRWLVGRIRNTIHVLDRTEPGRNPTAR
jgi:CelD/BcsL family acetyltransferase involved in cellulose biosynthesis